MFIHAVLYVKLLSFLKADYYSSACVDHILFIQSSVDGYLVASTFWL